LHPDRCEDPRQGDQSNAPEIQEIPIDADQLNDAGGRNTKVEQIFLNQVSLIAGDCLP